MAQTVIRISCTDQTLKTIEAPIVSSGGIGENKVIFDFCPLWDGFSKVAVFQLNEDTAYQAVIGTDNSCIIPAEPLMSQGNLYIGVYGVNADGVKRTTSLLKYKVAQGALEGVRPTEPTPEIYEQILAKIADVAYPEVPVQSVNGKSGKVILTPEDIGAQPAGNYIIGETDPTVPAWAKQATKPTYTAGEVGAEERGAMNTHNTSPDAHNDLRLLIEGLTSRFNAVFDSTDIDLDQMSEIVAYIKDNASLIESVTTSKVNVADIVDNLTTNVKEKPLSAAQGVVLKDLIDKLQSAVNDKVGARHEHSATEITSGILPVSRGGTGMSTGQNPNAVINLNGEGDCFNAIPTKSGALYATTENGTPAFGTLPVAQGGTGATTAEMARASLGVAAATHSHSITELGDLSLATSTADGLMSKEDKRKFDDLDTNLETVSDLAREASSDVKEFREDFEPHISNTSNPHSVTASQVGALPTSGGTLTGAITLPNNTAIKSKDGSGTAQEVVRVNGSNQIVMGASGVFDSVVTYQRFVPATAAVNTLDIGGTDRRFRNLYFSGNLSDGTNSIAIANIANKNDIPTIDTEAIYSSVAEAKSDVKDLREEIANLVNGAPEALNTLDELAAALKDNAGIVDTLEAAIGKKANDYSLALYNGTGGNPKPVKFLTVNYSTCGSETGVAVKIGMVSGHGNGVSYTFLQDAIIKVNHTGNVEADIFKYYGADTTYDGAKQYGDIFWVHDATNKIVDFYCLMGQYAWLYATPYKRVTNSSGGTITQHTSCVVYSSGTREWANKKLLGSSGGDISSHLSDTSNPHKVTAEQVGALSTGGGTLTGTLVAPAYKGDTSAVGLKPSDSNEINFSSNANYLYFGYENRMGSVGVVDTYKFGKHNGAGGATSGRIECGEVVEGGTSLTDKYAPKSLSDAVEAANSNALEAKSDVKDMRESLAGYETTSASSNKLLEAKAYTNTGVQEAKSYTDTAISNLINSAPTTLDTLGEIATAMQNNADVVTALEQSIGGKANSTHNHSAADINAGTLPLSYGGTGTSLAKTNNAIIRFSGSGNYFSKTATASGAMYATSANGAPTFGTLPVAQGGTGATDAATALSNLGGLPKSGGTLSGSLDFTNGESWITPFLLAFKNASAGPATYPYTGFYQWGDEWQVNARDASNTFVHNIMAINLVSKVANFSAVPTVNGSQLALKNDVPTTAAQVGALSTGGGTVNGKLTLNNSTEASVTNPPLTIISYISGDSGITETAKIGTFADSPYGIVIKNDPDGTSVIQSQRFANDTEKFPLSLNPYGGNVLVNGFQVALKPDLDALAARVAALETTPMITFTIAGTSYNARQGMTWGEWVYSSFNTAGASLTSDKRIQMGALVANDYGSGYQYDTYEIRAGAAYVISA